MRANGAVVVIVVMYHGVPAWGRERCAGDGVERTDEPPARFFCRSAHEDLVYLRILS